MNRNDSPSFGKPGGRKAKKRSGGWRRALLWTLGAVLLAGVVAGLMPQPVPVETSAVSRGPLTVSVFEEGKTRIRHRYTVSPPVAGFLERVPLRAGDRIEAGKTVLATLRAESAGFLDPRAKAQAEARWKGAEAAILLREEELERARSMKELAEKEFARADALLASSGVSRQEWDSASSQVQVRGREVNAAEFALRVTRFEAEQAQAALVQADATSGKSASLQILAPVSGFVLKVHEESERVVAAGTPILEVGDTLDLEAEIELLSSDAVAVREGAAVSIEHWGGEKPLQGRVSLVERGGFTKISALGVEEQRVLVRVDFVDPFPEGEELGDRFRVEARIVTWHGDKVLQVPVGALFRRGNDWMVFVVRDGKALRRTVGIGRNNGVAAQVLSGLEEGDEVILHPPETLEEEGAVTSS